jgi:hypothetical protein
MRKSIIALMLGALLNQHVTTFAQTPSAQEIKLKQKVVELGTEQNVKIKLKSEEVLKGRLTDIKTDSFIVQVVDLNGQVINRTLAYSELSKVSKVGVGENRKALRRGLLQGAGVIAAGMGIILVMSLIASATID